MHISAALTALARIETGTCDLVAQLAEVLAGEKVHRAVVTSSNPEVAGVIASLATADTGQSRTLAGLAHDRLGGEARP